MADPIKITVEYPCSSCEGTGFEHARCRGERFATDTPCFWCQGTGYKLNQLGEAILEMLDRRGFIKLHPEESSEES